MLSKARFVSAQLERYLADDRWLERAWSANSHASELAQRLGAIPGVAIAALNRMHVNNSHIDNTEIVEFTAQSNAFVRMKVRSQFWTPCVDGSRRTHVAVGWHVLPPQ